MSPRSSQAGKSNKSPDTCTIKYAYVTFRSMHDKNQVLKAYNISSRYRFVVNNLCCCCMREQQEMLRQRMFYDRWIKVKKASEPDEIQWENLGVSKLSRCCRRTCVWIFAVIIILVAIVGMVQFKVNSDDAVKNGYNTQYDCPQEVDKTAAT